MLSDKFFPTPLPRLLELTLRQLDNHSFFGIPSALFFRPSKNDGFRTYRYGQLLETPVGVAAGPHTQLSQNIVAAWLTGSRFIELKTIQTLDELEIPKPCIDMQDEGYNCEWSQELKITESFGQYLDAWIIIHILRHRLGFEPTDQPGFIFNMSVGYNYDGIMNSNVQWFLDKMTDASEEVKQKVESIRHIYPAVLEIDINPCLSNNVTLSTMHGCPPDEIEKIANYLLSERKLHTAVKLNPTLIGEDFLRKIIAGSGFEIQVPDQAFAHDLKYADAIRIIKNLQATALKNNRSFSLKLTNTLESLNHKEVFAEEIATMYNSGRSLHPVSINLALKLQEEFQSGLDISFSGGAHAFNIADITRCGLWPVTVCTDLLKPGGYGRMFQYVEELRNHLNNENPTNTDVIQYLKSGKKDLHLNASMVNNLRAYAEKTLLDKLYQKQEIHDINIKTQQPLATFDCIAAPCVNTCSTNQDIPNYIYNAGRGDFEKSHQIILQTNPFPRTTGMICDHQCQQKCTRIHYDEALHIRDIKKFVAENASAPLLQAGFQAAGSRQKSVAIIGAGPSGLAAARFLAQAGFFVKIFEKKGSPGGMVSGVIPPFRLTNEAIQADTKPIEDLGISISYGFEADSVSFGQLRAEFDYVYIAAGAQQASRLKIPGIECHGIVDPLWLLEQVRQNRRPQIGKNVAIIGGGNTAMDAARTAMRLVGAGGKVTVVYRRTIKEMPADLGEIKAVMQEGIEIMELMGPLAINHSEGKVSSLKCIKMKLGAKDASGRRSPVEVAGSEFDLPADSIIPAVGQDKVFDFGFNEPLRVKPGTYQTQFAGVFIGGDALRGASTAINAIGDGRKVAQEIIDIEKRNFSTRPVNPRTQQPLEWHMVQRATRKFSSIAETNVGSAELNFNLISKSLTGEEILEEAKRCLLCDEFCSICTTVCPNLALQTYKTDPLRLPLQKVIVNKNTIRVNPGEEFRVDQSFQILHLSEWCNHCGNCTTFCPTSDSPYLKKPHLFLNKKAFEMESEGYYFENNNGNRVLFKKENGALSSLLEADGDLIYSAFWGEITLTKKDLKIKCINILNGFEGEISLRPAAEMAVIMQGAYRIVKPAQMEV